MAVPAVRRPIARAGAEVTVAATTSVETAAATTAATQAIPRPWSAAAEAVPRGGLRRPRLRAESCAVRERLARVTDAHFSPLFRLYTALNESSIVLFSRLPPAAGAALSLLPHLIYLPCLTCCLLVHCDLS